MSGRRGARWYEVTIKDVAGHHYTVFAQRNTRDAATRCAATKLRGRGVVPAGVVSIKPVNEPPRDQR